MTLYVKRGREKKTPMEYTVNMLFPKDFCDERSRGERITETHVEPIKSFIHFSIKNTFIQKLFYKTISNEKKSYAIKQTKIEPHISHVYPIKFFF